MADLHHPTLSRRTDPAYLGHLYRITNLRCANLGVFELGAYPRRSSAILAGPSGRAGHELPRQQRKE